MFLGVMVWSFATHLKGKRARGNAHVSRGCVDPTYGGCVDPWQVKAHWTMHTASAWLKAFLHTLLMFTNNK